MKNSAQHPIFFQLDGTPIEDDVKKNRGLNYGDGVFETIRIVNATMPLWKYHWRRLTRSLDQLAIFYDKKRLYNNVKYVLTYIKSKEILANGILKIIVTRGAGEKRGYAFDPSTRDDHFISWHPLPYYPDNYWHCGVTLFPCTLRLGHQPMLAGIKHLSRIEQVMARSEWSNPNFAEGLLLDIDESPIEGVMSNLFVVGRNNVLITPILDKCGVNGVMRAWILAYAKHTGFPTEITKLDLQQLENAAEVFLCNSVYGVWPVKGYKTMSWSIGHFTLELQRSIATLFNLRGFHNIDDGTQK